MNRKRHTFKGWSMNVAFMPAQDLTIMAIWEESKSIISLILAAEIVIPILLIVIIILIIMLLLMHKKSERKTNERDLDLYKSLIPPPKDSHPDGYSRVISVSKAEVESNISQNVSMNVLSRFYTKNYERPTMKDALAGVDLTEKHVKLICNACESAATIISDEGKLFNKFTKDDAAAIAMYTYDFGPGSYEKNPYRLINKNLIERNYAGLQKASGLLYLLMTALRKLPKVTGTTLYRGVGREINLSKGYYNKGGIITWPGLSSASPDIVTTKALLAKGSTNGMAAGTLFIIENGWGYDIQPYSLFPDEEEILLEPEREFEVTGVIEAEGLTFINLKMQDTPLPLPDVFGSGIE